MGKFYQVKYLTRTTVGSLTYPITFSCGIFCVKLPYQAKAACRLPTINSPPIFKYKLLKRSVKKSHSEWDKWYILYKFIDIYIYKNNNICKAERASAVRHLGLLLGLYVELAGQVLPGVQLKGESFKIAKCSLIHRIIFIPWKNSLQSIGLCLYMHNLSCIKLVVLLKTFL